MGPCLPSNHHNCGVKWLLFFFPLLDFFSYLFFSLIFIARSNPWFWYSFSGFSFAISTGEPIAILVFLFERLVPGKFGPEDATSSRAFQIYHCTWCWDLDPHQERNSYIHLFLNNLPGKNLPEGKEMLVHKIMTRWSWSSIIFSSFERMPWSSSCPALEIWRQENE